MLFTLQEYIYLLGISGFEILSLLLGSLAFPLTAVLTAEGVISSWTLGFTPLFVSTGANWYYSAILLIRSLGITEDVEDRSKAIRNFIWSLMTICIQAGTCVMVALRLEEITGMMYAEAFAPLFVYLAILIVYSCICCYKKQRQEFS